MSEPRTATGRKVLAIYGSALYDDILAIEAEARLTALRDALISVGMLNGNGRDEPSDPALNAAEDRLRRLIETTDT